MTLDANDALDVLRGDAIGLPDILARHEAPQMDHARVHKDVGRPARRPAALARRRNDRAAQLLVGGPLRLTLRLPRQQRPQQVGAADEPST